MRPAGAVAGALGLVAVASLLAPARAVTIRESSEERPAIELDVTESFFSEYHSELDDPSAPNPEHVVDFRNRLNTRLEWRMLTFGTRLDTALFLQPDAADDRLSDQFQDDLRLEELYLKGRFDDLTLTLGDDYVSFGRGLSLSIRKVDELGFDVKLRGGHLRYRSEFVNVQAHAGVTNVTNVDSVDEKLVPDPKDFVAAGRVELKPIPKLLVGLHGVDVERRHSDVVGGVSRITPGPLLSQAVRGRTSDLGGIDTGELSGSGDRFQRSWIVGGNVRATSLGGVVDLYAEGDYLRTERSTRGLGPDGEPQQLGRTDEGWATYGSATFYLDRWTVLAEVKHYDDFEVMSTPHPDTDGEDGIQRTFSYITPPSLERNDQRIRKLFDVTGTRVRVDYRLPDDWGTLFVNQGYFRDAPEDGEFTTHTFAGWEYRMEAGHRMQFQLGYRHAEAPDAGIVRNQFVQGDLNLFFLLNERHDVQITWDHRFRRKDQGAGELARSFHEGTLYLTWNLNPNWSFTPQLGYENAPDRDRPLFPGAFVTYRFTQSSSIELFGGRIKGGLICSGGVCRVFPDFPYGAKLNATVRF